MVGRNKNQILIARNDTKLSTLLARALEDVGFLVEAVRFAQDALKLLETGPITLIFIDLPMFNIDDAEFLQTIHQLRPETLIVARHRQPTIESAVTAIKVGAIDYLLGPPDTSADVQAVLSALHKRAEQTERLVEGFIRGAKLYLNGAEETPSAAQDVITPVQPSMVVGDLSLHLPTRTLSSVSKPERSVNLTDGESQILFTLMRQPRKGLSCRAILWKAKGYDMLDIEAQAVVRPYISRIRRKLSDAQIGPHTIRTVRGLGYIFEPALATKNRVNYRSR